MSQRTTLKQRRLAYKRAFMDDGGKHPTADGDAVLKDLHKFCFGHKAAMVYSPTSGQFDPLACAFAQGKQEVLRRIQEHLLLDDRYIINAREERQNDD